MRALLIATCFWLGGCGDAVRNEPERLATEGTTGRESISKKSKIRIDATNADTLKNSIMKAIEKMSEQERAEFSQSMYVLLVRKKDIKVDIFNHLYLEDYNSLYSNGFEYKAGGSGGFSNLVFSIGDQIHEKSVGDIIAIADTERSSFFAESITALNSEKAAIARTISELQRLLEVNQTRATQLQSLNSEYDNAAREIVSDIKILEWTESDLTPSYLRNPIDIDHFSHFKFTGSMTVKNTLAGFFGDAAPQMCGVNFKLGEERETTNNYATATFQQLPLGGTADGIVFEAQVALRGLQNIQSVRNNPTRVFAKYTPTSIIDCSGTRHSILRWQLPKLQLTRQVEDAPDRIKACEHGLAHYSRRLEEITVLTQALERLAVNPEKPKFDFTLTPSPLSYRSMPIQASCRAD